MLNRRSCKNLFVYEASFAGICKFCFHPDNLINMVLTLVTVLETRGSCLSVFLISFDVCLLIYSRITLLVQY